MSLVISEIRLWNMRSLADQVGNITKLANRLNKAQTQVSGMIGKTPHKGIGSSVARQVELVFGKPEGWMDVPHPEEWVQIKTKAWRVEAKEAAERSTSQQPYSSKEPARTAPVSIGRVNIDLLTDVIEVVRDVTKEFHLDLPPRKEAQLIGLMYDEFAAADEVDIEAVQGKVIKLVQFLS